MWRAHSQLLLLPLTQPFNLTSRAVALPQGQIALELLLTTAPSCSVLVKDVTLVPQLGLQMVEGPHGAAHLPLPLLLQPGASAALTFVLTRAVGKAPAAAGGRQPPASFHTLNLLCIHHSQAAAGCHCRPCLMCGVVLWHCAGFHGWFSWLHISWV
jgi:hypothetical protein